MLIHMCTEKLKHWERYIGPLWFAYREVRQESLGYSLFELLYGRTVKRTDEHFQSINDKWNCSAGS